MILQNNKIQIFYLIDFFFIIGIFYVEKIHQKRFNCTWWGYKPIKRLKRKRKKSIPLGIIIYKNHYLQKLSLDIEELKRHILIYGQTGTGKTSFIMYFLKEVIKKLKPIPFTLFEFKGEYAKLQTYIPDLLILEPGINFSINLFDKDIFSSENYAEILFDSLKSCRILDFNSEFSPQMESVLVDVLKRVCQSSEPKTWSNFFSILYDSKNQLKNSIPQIENTIVSIKNRLRRFSYGPLSAVFSDTKKTLKVSEILQRKTVINLGSILKLGGSKQDLIFFANLILKWIWEMAMNRNPTDQLKHLTIFEDVSYIASNKLVNLSNVSLYLEDIALLLRGKGEGLLSITTSMDISKNIVLNSGTKLFFKFNERSEDIIHHLGIEKGQTFNIQDLPTGMCIIKTYSNAKPFLLYTNNIEGSASKKKKNQNKFFQKLKLKKKEQIIKNLRKNKQENLKKEEILTLNNTKFKIVKDFYEDLLKKIHQIEELIFCDNYLGAMLKIFSIFDKLTSIIQNEHLIISEWKDIQKRYVLLKELVKNPYNSELRIEDCLNGLKLAKIVRNMLKIDNRLENDENIQGIKNNLQSNRNLISLQVFIIETDSNNILEFYSLGLQVYESYKKHCQEIYQNLSRKLYKEKIAKRYVIFIPIELEYSSYNFKIIFTLASSYDNLFNDKESRIIKLIEFHLNKLKKVSNDIFLGFNLPKMQLPNSSVDVLDKKKQIIENSKLIKQELKELHTELEILMNKSQPLLIKEPGEKIIENIIIQELEPAIKYLLSQNSEKSKN
ncbi:ATP-binding protein [Candidatus Harpocratesius sp.]